MIPPLHAAAAQVTVTGIVRDSASGQPIEQVEVLVEPGFLASTDSAGRYVLALPGGTHRIRFRRIGYTSLEIQADLSNITDLELEVALAPVPLQLPGLEVITPAPPTWAPGFEQRRKAGLGQFLTSDLLRSNDHRRFSDLIRTRVSGIRLATVGTKAVALGRGATWCPMAIWLDGVRIYAPGAEETSPFLAPRRDAPDLNDWNITELEAVEIYSASETPAQFQATGSSCGTILLWTRMR